MPSHFFEPSNVKIGSVGWAQVSKTKVGKGIGRKIRIWVSIFTHLWGSMGWNDDHYQIYFAQVFI
jgi:hypothetical protein